MNQSISPEDLEMIDRLRKSVLQTASVDVLQRVAQLGFLCSDGQLMSLKCCGLSHLSYTTKALDRDEFNVREVTLHPLRRNCTAVLDYTIHYSLTSPGRTYFGFATSLENQPTQLYHLNLQGDHHFDLVAQRLIWEIFKS